MLHRPNPSHRRANQASAALPPGLRLPVQVLKDIRVFASSTSSVVKTLKPRIGALTALHRLVTAACTSAAAEHFFLAGELVRVTCSDTETIAEDSAQQGK